MFVIHKGMTESCNFVPNFLYVWCCKQGWLMCQISNTSLAKGDRHGCDLRAQIWSKNIPLLPKQWQNNNIPHCFPRCRYSIIPTPPCWTVWLTCSGWVAHPPWGPSLWALSTLEWRWWQKTLLNLEIPTPVSVWMLCCHHLQENLAPPHQCTGTRLHRHGHRGLCKGVWCSSPPTVTALPLKINKTRCCWVCGAQ